MALYEIYKRIGKSGRHDGNILILKDKLSIIALIFPPLWLVINRNFFIIPIYFLAIFFIIFLSNKTGQEIIIFSVIFCHFFFAIQANILREWILKFKNYQLDSIIKAENKMSAYNIYNRDINIKSSESMQSPNTPENNKNDDETILNIF
jgi:hypothetical protein